MKVIKSYSSVWRIERVLYHLNDWKLPRPVTYSTLFWFLSFFVLSVFLKGIPPFVFQDSVLMNHVAIPAFFTWLMNKKTFDGKKPYSFVWGYVRYVLRPHIVTRGKAADFESFRYPEVLFTVGRKREREAGRKGRKKKGGSDTDEKGTA